jgi:AraC-like DNA-binding protein
MAIGPLYRPFLELAREARVDVAGVLAELGLTEAQVLQPSTRLSPDLGRALGRELVSRMGDPEVGLRAAERIRLLDADLLGYLVRHSPSPLAAIEQIARYARLIGDTAAARVERARGQVVVTFGLPGGLQMLPEATDYLVACICRFVRDLSGGRARPIAVRLDRPRPRRPSAYRRFFECPVAFGAEYAALEYAEGCLTVPMREDDPRLVAILENRADEVMSTLPRHAGVVERVRAHIGRHLESGGRDLSTIAAELRMSERTVRRRLQDAGRSYRTLLDEVRRERALALVRQGDHTVGAIAQRVGFSDATAFARAFRRWTGVAPHEYGLRL